MSLFNRLRKPAWQSSNAERRAAAVASGDDADLVAALPRLALEDPDVEVRRAALRRCDDPALYGKAGRGDADTELREWARQRWVAAMAGGRIGEPTDEDLRALTAAEREHLAASAGSAALRRRLLDTIQRPGFLAERAGTDPDAAIRMALVDRIDDPALLDRIADRARRNDKRLSRAARERAEQLRLAGGGEAALQRRAMQLAEAIEALMRDGRDPAERATVLEQLQSQWTSLLQGATLPPALVARFEGAARVVEAQLAPPPPAPVETPTVALADAAPEPAAPSPEEIAAQARLQAELAANAERVAREKALAEERRRAEEARRAEESRRLGQLAKALAEGDTATARTLAGGLDASVLSPADRRTWQDVQAQLKKLEGWEHWASNKVRARLCEQVEALVGSGLHPDALATRVRELQAEWRALDDSEGRGADAEPTGLDKRFRVGCARVLKPARGFFRKRDELRSEQQQAIRQFLDQARARLETAGEDAAVLMDVQRGAVEQLRSLDGIGHADRRALAGELRTLLDTVKPQIESVFEQREAERAALIAAARKLASENDGRRIAAQARELGQQWKAIGKGRTGRDQQQWREFRAALDAVFAGLDEKRQQTEQARAQVAAQAEAVLVELESLAAPEGDDLTTSAAKVRALRERWQSLPPVDRALAERYDSALTRHRDAMARHEVARRRERYLQAIVSGAPVDDAVDESATASALALVFEAESLAEIEAPDDEREVRRRWQLDRLQQRMRGETAHGEGDAAEGILARWREMRGLAAADRERFAARLSRAIEHLLDRR